MASDSQRSFAVFGITFAFAVGFLLGWFYANLLAKFSPVPAPESSLTAESPFPVRHREPLTNDTTALPRRNISKTPQTPKAVLDRLLADLEAVDSSQTEPFPIMGRLQQLKDFGEDGSRVIQDYLRTQQDVVFPLGRFQTLTGEPVASLRTALIASLNGVDDPTTRAMNLEVLRTSSASAEIAWAARNLETLAPGAYRTEILSAISETLHNAAAPRPASQGYETYLIDPQLFELIAHFQAVDLVPDVDEILKKDPRLVPEWLHRLTSLPEDAQLLSVRSLLNDEGGKSALLANSPFLAQLDLQNNEVRQLVRFIFQTGMTLPQREALLQQIGRTGSMEGFSGDASGANLRARLESEWKLLSELDPQIAPTLRPTSLEARKRLQDQLSLIH